MFLTDMSIEIFKKRIVLCCAATNMQDLFKEMFGSEDPFADFHKFFEDVRGQRWLYDLIFRLIRIYEVQCGIDT